MSQKLALFVSAVVTVFVVIITGALVVRLGAPAADPPPSAASAPAVAGEPGTVSSPLLAEDVLQREQRSRQQMDEANTRLQHTYDQVRTLQGELGHLRAQNATLVEREQTYQQRLEQANRLLQSGIVTANGPGEQGQATPRADAKAHRAPTGKQARGERHHDKEHDDD